MNILISSKKIFSLVLLCVGIFLGYGVVWSQGTITPQDEAESCELFDGFDPQILQEGESIDAWSAPEADWDHTCDDLYHEIICDANFYVTDFLEDFPYPSCQDYDWADCEADGLLREHNEFTTLFSAQQSNYDETCSELSVNVTCRDGDFYL